MTIVDGALAAAAILGWALLALALWDRSSKVERIGALETAAATALAAAQTNRADVADRQLAAANQAKKEAEADADHALEDALAHDGVVDPTTGWDRHAGGAPPVVVLPPAGAGTGPGRDAAAVPDRAAGDHPVAGADPVPVRRP